MGEEWGGWGDDQPATDNGHNNNHTNDHDGGWGENRPPRNNFDNGYADSSGPPPRKRAINLEGDGGGRGNSHGRGFGQMRPDNGDMGADGEDRPPPFKPDEVDLEDEEKLRIDQGINFDRFDRIEVDCRGANLKPVDSFDELITSELLLQNIKKANYTRMTPIQRYTIPAMANGHDLVGCAQTGSGKTAAFLLPVLQTILNVRDLDSAYGQETQRPYCIIIAPTRELARQTYVEALKLSRDSIVKCQCIYGGVQTGYLRAQLSKGAHVLVATPGRLKDFLGRGWISLENIKYMILDEGDRLIDDGFVTDMRVVFTHSTMPGKEGRQTMFFSATFKQDAQRLATEFMKPDYLFITVGMVGAANEDVKQEFIRVERPEKKRELKKILLALGPEERVIVFTQTKATADIISGFLSSSGVLCTSIHGDRHQSQREQALHEFKRGIKRVLVASPVGERGLDLPKVSMVINYDMPNELDEYVHRIGRTGRIGNTGRAISFFDPDRDSKLISELTRALKQAQQEVPDFFSEGAYGYISSNDFAESNDLAASGSGGGDQDEEAW